MTMANLGQQLPQGDAKVLYERFQEFKATLSPEAQEAIPNAVCFSVNELENYLAEVNSMLAAAGVPTNERCIALMPGKYDGNVEKEHLRDKVTTIFIASRATGDDTGKVTLLENCVVGSVNDEESGGDGDIGDLSYNVGSLNP